MAKQLSVGSEYIWLSAASPGLSETSVNVGNWWLNTTTNNLFLCKDNTLGAQVWDEYPVATVPVPKGGTGLTSATAYAVLCGGTTATGALQSIAGVGSAGEVLTSNGAGALPTFQAASASGAVTSITGDSGGAQVPSSGNFNLLGSGSITVAGSANTETVQLTGLTDHSVLVGAGTSTITKLAVGATGTVLAGNTGADPAFTATPSVTSIAIGTPTITSGAGAPGSTQPKGSLYLRTDGSGVNDRMYVATDSAGAWTAVVTVT